MLSEVTKQKSSLWKKKIMYSSICFGIFFGMLGLARLIFGTGDVTAVLFLLPAIPFFMVAPMILGGLFDDLLRDGSETK